MRRKKNVDSKPDNVFIEKAWSKLASGDGVDNSLLRHEIALSWQRCLKSNVNPSNISSNVAIKDLLEREKSIRNFIEVAKPHMRSLYEIVKGKGYIVILTDNDGVILKIIGDRKMSSIAESLTLVPGASCSEKVIGTTSPGVCLIQKKPIQVFSHEHYCQQYHNWCCSAAPIFDTLDNLIGTLDLSNINENSHHPLLLELVRMTAKTIESEFNLRTAQNDFKKSYYYFNSIVDDLPEALIFFDDNNNLCHLNKRAIKLLGANSKKFLGVSLYNISLDHEKLNDSLYTDQCRTVLQFPTAHGLTELNANLTVLKCDSKKIGIRCEVKTRNQIPLNGNVTRYSFSDFIYRSKKIKSLIKDAQKIAATDVNVFIQGESGTGKEVLAQAIHTSSSRRDKPFIAVNCAAIPQELIQSELFGYEEGTFTGAKKGGKQGKFELAQNGTLFLDEIGDMPLEAQANLLRVLQERSLMRLGGSIPIPLNIRVIAATNKDFLSESDVSNFREDLFYRLSVFSIAIPPLRERREDIWEISDYLISKHSRGTLTLSDLSFSPQVTALINTYKWPGNVRELENAILYILNKIESNTVTIDEIPKYLTQRITIPPAAIDLKKVELDAIQSALSKYGNNISSAAKLLGISRSTLYRKMKKLGLD